MTRMIFVNLPVVDLDRSKAFYETLGFANNPQFSDEAGACMVLSDAIFVMLLTHDKWRSFTTRPIPSTNSSEVMLAISCENREEVDRLADTSGREGGIADINPAQDHGFMFSRSYADPDGHVWEAVWMDPAFAGADENASEAEATA